MRLKLFLVALAAFLASIGLAWATANIHINLSTQTMHVESGSGSYTWPVSTARAGYSTPRGSYAPTGLQRMHYSRKYHMSPMPYSIFFRGGYAIHGTYATGALGSPASHGCVRLAPGNAKRLYEIVQSEGGSISITGAPPSGGARYAKAHHRNAVHYASLRRVHRAHAMAYASVRHYHRGTVRSWQAEPFAPYY
ncbi:L,D-transpeptidase [Methylocystis sp. S23]